METRCSLMIVVFLCAAMSLACCQSNGISSSTSIGDDNDEIRRYEADYTDRSNEETDLDSDDPFYEQIVSYRSNRAIDVFRSTEANTKLTEQLGQQLPNLPKFSTKATETVVREKGRRRVNNKNVMTGDGICQSIDIRNSASAFGILKDCRVIEGFLQIVLIENNSERDFQPISFPKLREITGYLLLYRVNGLKSLSNLFPNLEVIRGNILLTDYAFMVYEMQNLQEIGLKKLTEISRGSTRIEKNPALCYTTTLNWDFIVSAGENVIKDNGEEASCPGCSHCPEGYCWTSQYCQRTDKPKCHDQCLGECHGSTESECYVCKHYRHEGKCVETCPSHLYSYLSRRCVTKDECVGMNRLRRVNYILEDGQAWRPFNGSCVTHCPDGYEDALDENNMTMCRACVNSCRKVSHGALIRHISDAQSFRGITVVKGALEFQIRNGNPNIMNELSEAFGRVEEVSEYVKIAHSFPITSLNFLKKLKVIKGEKLDINNSSLSVLDNPNLSSLFPPGQEVKIENGRLFFHYNPKLCLSTIIQFSQMVNITNYTDLEIQPQSNGEKVACDIVNINITVKNLGPDYADLMWDSYEPPEGQKLLNYLLNYIETENQNITYEMNACGGNNTWQIVDVDIPKWNATVSKHISSLKPYTKYAVYVKTLNARSSKFVEPVGQSRIIFFRTRSTIPSPPTNVVSQPLSDTEILVKWEPPLFPNGPIGYYMVSSVVIYEDDSLISTRDYCNHTLENELESDQLVPDVTVKTPVANRLSCCSKNTDGNIITSKKFEIFCHENTTISYISPGWKDYCVYNTYNDNNVDDQFYELTNNLSTPRPEEEEKETDTFKSERPNVMDKHAITYNVSDGNKFVIKNLRHYTRYIISIAACGVKVNKSNLCSSIQYTYTRTKKRVHSDDVENVKVQVTNNTIVEVSWDSVKDPNAITVSYTIEYTNLDVKDAKKSTECIPRTGRKYTLSTVNSYFIKNLSPGKYSLRVRSTSLAGDGNFSNVVYFSIGLSDTTPITLITLITTLIVLFVILIVLFFLLKYHQKKKKQERLIASVNPDYIETKYVIDEWEVPRESVEILEELGLGNFGMVYRGVYDKNTPVAIKTISKTASPREKNEFLNEASVMKNFSTFHIIKLIGVVSIENPPFVVMELMENGDLKTYLRRIRDTHLVPDACRIMRMAAEIADGMAYLESKKYVHRDLAARNCMVSKDLVCKIGDFGMARDVYETDYYKIGRKGLLPIRWMAPENLSDGVFTSDSDVWSFGVVLYEILTLAEIPYQGFSNEEVLSHVLHKGTLNIPRNCPENIQKIMEKCFKWRPSDRPTFMEVVSELEPFLGQDFYEKSFYHSSEGVESRNSGMKKPYHHAAPIRFHWANETARWVKEFEDNVTLLDQTKAGTSRGRIFKNGFQHFGQGTMTITTSTSHNYKKARTRFIERIPLVLLLLTINKTSSVRICNSSSENWQSRIGILISPTISRSKIREIEIYWNNVNIMPGDKLSLFEQDSTGVHREIYTVTPNSRSGFQKTGILAEYIPSSNLSFVEKCIKYEVVWLTDKKVKKMECLKTQPNWMKERKNILGTLKIKQIFLPGTHDSAIYDENGKRRSIISDLAITQDLDILGQLIHGVRYLDIRVGHYPNTKEIWWTNHGPFYRSVSLKTVIDQVKKFLDNTEEIVIMDIREFPIGFDKISDHHKLVSYLENEFRNYFLPNNYGWNITLNEIWSFGKRLIIGYENMEIVNSRTNMWPCVLHQWGDVKSTEQLYQHLYKIETSNRNGTMIPRSAMAELTSDLKNILFNRLRNLREMAHKVNLNVTNWYSTIWQYTANIVSVDFVRSTDIVEIAIKSNENRHLYCR